MRNMTRLVTGWCDVVRLRLGLLPAVAALLMWLVPAGASAQILTQPSGPNLGTLSRGIVYVVVGASGGTGSYSWSVVGGALPPGTALRTDGLASSQAGVIGVATTAGTYSFTIRLTSGASFVDKTYSLKIVDLSIDDYANLPKAHTGRPYAYQFTSTNGTGTWTATSGVPPGLTFSASGLLSGTPTTDGFYNPQVRLTNGVDTIVRSTNISVESLEITNGPWLPNYTVGTPYTVALQASGGTPPYTFVHAAGNGLPSGLTLTPAGVLSGIPASSGTLSLYVTVTDATGRSAWKTLGLSSVDSPATPISVSVFGADGCFLGDPCFRNVFASGGIPPYTFSASGLPAGMHAGLSERSYPTSIEIVGAAAQLGSFDVTVTATDSVGETGSNVFRIEVPELARHYTSQPSATLGQPYSYQLSIIGGLQPYSASFLPGRGKLPDGLTLDPASLLISGTPTEIAYRQGSVDIVDAAGRHLVNTVGVDARSANGSTISPNAFDQTLVVGATRTIALSACCVPSYSWTLAGGTLPPGMSLFSSGAVTGTPTQAGTYKFSLQAADATNPTNFGVRTVIYTVITAAQSGFFINTPTLPPFGNVGAAYGPVAFSTTGGTAPLSWSVPVESYLPPGLGFSSSGVLSGTPTMSGRFGFSVAATDATGYTVTNFVSVDIYPPGVIPPIAVSFSPGSVPRSLGALSFSLAATGGFPPYHYSITPGFQDLAGMGVQDGPPLPNGFTGTGAWLGVLATPGTFNSSLRVVDSAGTVLDKPFAVTVTDLVVESSTAPPRPVVGVPYSHQLKAVGGSGLYAWSVRPNTSLVLPPGLVLDSTGLITGTPLVPGIFTTFLTLTDTASNVSIAPSISFTVNPFDIVSGPVLPRATVGVPYSQVLIAPGCGTGCTWTGSAFGGIALSPSGVLSGTPTFTANGSFTASVTGSNGTGSRVLALQIMPSAPAPLSIANSTATSYVTIGTQFQTALSGFGGTPPYSWTVTSGALPTGTTLQGPGETLGGSAAPGFTYVFGRALTLGTYQADITVTDAVNATATRTLTWVVTPLNNFITSLPATGSTLRYNLPYSQQMLIGGGAGPYAFANTAPMPPGLTLSSTGLISGTPTNTGTFSTPIRVTDSNGAALLTNEFFNIGGPTSTVLSFNAPANLGVSQLGASSSFNVTPLGGTAPYTVIVVGSLPSGFALQGSGAGPYSVAGFPQAPGPYSFTLQATDAVGNVGVRTFSVVVTSLTLSFTTAQPDASVGVPYSQPVKVFDPFGTVAWSVAPGSTLPPGITVSGAGVLNGTPTTPGTYLFSLQATDSAGVATTVNLSLRVSAIAVTDPLILPPAAVAVPYSYAFHGAGGGSAPVWSATGLPGGLTLSASGVLSGTPTTAGSASFIVTVTDGVVPWSRTFMLPVSHPNPAPLNATFAATLFATVNQLFTTGLFANGGVPPYAWSVAPGSALPPGLSFVPSTDIAGRNTPGTMTLTGVPSLVGLYGVDLNITDAVGSTIARRLTIEVTPVGLVTTVLSNAVVGTPYSVPLVAVGGTAPYTFTAAVLSPLLPAVPPGLTLSSTGLLSGVPTGTGSYAIDVVVHDAQGHTFERVVPLLITNARGDAIVTNATRLDVQVGKAFFVDLSTALGQPVTWSFVTAPPSGVQLAFIQSAAATVTGTVSVPGTHVFTLRATSVSNPSSVADVQLTLNVVPFQMVDPPTGIDFNAWDLPTARKGQPYSFALKLAGGTAPYQFVLGTATPLPVGLTLSSAGVISGIPQATGFYAMQVVVTDASGATAQMAGVRLTVVGPGAPMPLVRTTTYDPPRASVGVPYAFALDTFVLRGGTSPFTWTVDPATPLPAGLRVIAGTNGVDNYVGGVPTTPGQSAVLMHVTDATGQALPTTLQFDVSQIVVSPDTSTPGRVGVPFFLPLTVSGGVSPYSVALFEDSDLPPGLTFANGTLSGTPTFPGNFMMAVEIVDALGNEFSKIYVVTIDNAAGDAPAFSLGPKPIQVYYEIGSPIPQGLVVSAQTTSGAVPYTLSMGGIPGATLSSTGGTTSGTTTLNIDPTGLGQGTYVGLLAGTAARAVNLLDAVPVTLVVAPPPPCSFTAIATSATFPATSGSTTPLSGSFTVSTASNCRWTVTSGAPSVVSVSPGFGTGPGKVTYTIKDNTGAAARNLPITVLDQTATKVAAHVITQFGSACAFSLSPAALNVGASGGNALVTVTASAAACAWSSSVGTSGLVVSPASGTGTTTLTVSVPANVAATTATRVASIGGKALTITQAGTGCTVGLSPYSGAASASGGQGSVDVTLPTGCTYDTTASASWLSVTSGATGTASGTVLYSVTPNSTTTPRSGSLLIGGQPFVVTQAAQACSFTLGTTGLGSPYGPAGTTGSVQLIANGSNCVWSASSSDPGMATVSPASGVGSATVGVTIASNAASPVGRNADLSIAGQTIPIVQGGTSCSYALQSTSGSVPAGGGSGSLGVIAPSVCTWSSISSAPTWLAITASGNAGSSDVQFFAQPNTAATPRTGTVTAAGLAYTVTQAAAPCGYTLTATSTNVSKDGANGSFGFSTTASSCQPQAQSYAGWITPTTTFNGASGTVDFIVAANPLAVQRSGLIQLGQQSFLITQFAGSCAYSLSSYGRLFSASGGAASFLGSPSGLGCTPVVGTNQPSFIAVDPLQGPVLNLFTQGFTVSPFTVVGGYSATRTGYITFGGQFFAVKQTSW